MWANCLHQNQNRARAEIAQVVPSPSNLSSPKQELAETATTRFLTRKSHTMGLLTDFTRPSDPPSYRFRTAEDHLHGDKAEDLARHLQVKFGTQTSSPPMRVDALVKQLFSDFEEELADEKGFDCFFDFMKMVDSYTWVHWGQGVDPASQTPGLRKWRPSTEQSSGPLFIEYANANLQRPLDEEGLHGLISLLEAVRQLVNKALRFLPPVLGEGYEDALPEFFFILRCCRDFFADFHNGDISEESSDDGSESEDE